ncbi:MAG: SprT family zinc-dependent metalloprotease [Gammaproteobacteria bacterium]
MVISSASSPLSRDQRQLVMARTAEYVQSATELFRREIPPVTVLFDLSGQAAGQFRWTAGPPRCVIRYNPWVFAADFAHHLNETVAHEVAHYVTYRLHGPRSIAHGPEWRRVMSGFGVSPRASGHYSLAGVPVRRQARHVYCCDCRSHELSSTRHNRHQRGHHYSCRYCGGLLRRAEAL